MICSLKLSHLRPLTPNLRGITTGGSIQCRTPNHRPHRALLSSPSSANPSRRLVIVAPPLFLWLPWRGCTEGGFYDTGVTENCQKIYQPAAAAEERYVACLLFLSLFVFALTVLLSIYVYVCMYVCMYV